MRSTSRALTIDMATQPSTNGMSTKPAAVADIPLTCCRNSGTNEIAPNIAMPDRNPFTPAASTMRWRKSRNGMIGSRARRSTGTKAASATPAHGHVGQRAGQQRDGDRAERQVDVEDPAPRAEIGQQAAQQRPK